MNLREVLSGIPLIRLDGGRDEVILGISYDSRTVKPGYLFAAVKGEKKDGHDYLEEVLQKGAAAILSILEKPDRIPVAWIQVADEREALGLCSANFFRHPSREIKVIGITGTKGKTTISYILEEIIHKAQLKPGVIGTISYRGPELDISATRTTPESSDLQRMLRQLADRGATHCLMEVSSHALELKRVTGIEFDIAVFNNLSGEHLDYHTSMEDYFQAKKKLFIPGEKRRIAVVNSDDEWGRRLIPELSIECVTFGLDSSAMVQAEKFFFDEQGIEMVVRHPGGKMLISSPLLGKPNVYNILASIASSLSMNIPIPAIENGVAHLKGVPGRFEKIKNSIGIHIYVDYAHTDDALKNLLETAREMALKRVILVFGAGGDRDKTKRPRMGAHAGELADLTILTSDNPRSEDPLSIISDIEQGILKTGPGKYIIQPSRREAIKKAFSLAEKDDTVLVAGKGHEDYQIIQDKVLHFSDKEVIEEILKEMEGI